MQQLVRGAVLALAALVFHPCSLAQPGELDPSFGTGGISEVPVSVLSSTQVLATARQADGKILVAGEARASVTSSSGTPPTWRPAIGRLNADGSVDATFGHGGWILPDISNFSPEASATAIATTANGKILVGLEPSTYAGGAIGVMRLDATGAPDPDFTAASWNGDAILRLYGSDSMQLAGIAEQNGGIVVAASSPGIGNVTLFRLDSSGNVDYGFGVSGQAQIYPDGAGAIGARTLLVQPDGALYLAGWTDPQGPYDVISRDLLVVKLTATGMPDPQFGANGKVSVDFAGGGDEAFALAMDAQSRLVVAGKAGWPFMTDGSSQLGLVRLDPLTGALDAAFGDAGKVQLNPTNGFVFDSSITALRFTLSGDMILAGTAIDLNSSDPESLSILARIDSTGAAVPTFGANGSVVSPMSWGFYGLATGDAFADVALDGDQLLAMGTRSIALDPSTYGSPIRGFLLRERYDASTGALVGDTLTVQAIDAVARVAVATAHLADGRFVTVGSVGDSARLMRYLPSGELDTAFGDQGHVDFQAGGAPTAGRAIAVDASGHVLVAAVVTGPPGGSRWSLSRWSPDGVLDGTFANGDSRIDVQWSDISAMAPQPDGKVIVLGFGDFQWTVARVDGNGVLDASFGGSGIVALPFGGPGSVPALAIQRDGRLLIGGFLPGQQPQSGYNTIVRLMPDGSMDTSWGGGGFVQPQPPNGSIGTVDTLMLQPDGKIVTGGFAANYLTNFQPVPFLMRMLPDGEPDYSFGVAGGVQDNSSLGAAYVTGLALELDGKIVAGGHTVSGLPFAMRFDKDGSLDPAYAGSGYATANVQSDGWLATAVDADATLRLLGSTPLASGQEDVLLVQFQGQSIHDVPDPFQFADVIDAPVDTLVISAPVTITGINVPVPISVANGEYSIGCDGTFTGVDGTIVGGQNVCVRIRSSTAENTASQGQLTVGGVFGWFTVRTGTLPDTSFTSVPPALTASPSATFSFSSSDAAATFLCSLDGAPYSLCTSPASYSALAEGDHAFRVEAVDRIGPDPSPAQSVWHIDLTPPDTTIDSGPARPGASNPDTATFTFSSSEAGGSFECSLDGASFTTCSSPAVYDALPRGAHLFEVRARDTAGNVDASPASWAWRSH